MLAAGYGRFSSWSAGCGRGSILSPVCNILGDPMSSGFRSFCNVLGRHSVRWMATISLEMKSMIDRYVLRWDSNSFYTQSCIGVWIDLLSVKIMY